MILKKLFVILLLLFIYSNTSYASIFNSGKTKYGGVAIGSVDNNSPGVRDFNAETNATSVKVFAGVKYSSIFDIEFGLANLGTYKSADGAYTESFGALTIHAVKTIPFSNNTFQLYGQFGYGLLRWHKTLDLSVVSAEVISTGSSLIAGLGLKYHPSLFPNLAVHFHYDYYYYETSNGFTNLESESNALKMLGLNVSYTFHRKRSSHNK